MSVDNFAIPMTKQQILDVQLTPVPPGLRELQSSFKKGYRAIIYLKRDLGDEEAGDLVRKFKSPAEAFEFTKDKPYYGVHTVH